MKRIFLQWLCFNISRGRTVCLILWSQSILIDRSDSLECNNISLIPPFFNARAQAHVGEQTLNKCMGLTYVRIYPYGLGVTKVLYNIVYIVILGVLSLLAYYIATRESIVVEKYPR